MKRFEFRLQSIITLKKAGEFGAREFLLGARAQLESVKEIGLNLKQRLKDAMSKQEDLLQDRVSSSEILTFEHYIESLRQKIRASEDAFQAAQNIFDEAVESYRKYQAELKLINEMRDFDLSVHEKQEIKEMEQDYIDQKNLITDSENSLNSIK
jgi:flagellar export protein FliJ